MTTKASQVQSVLIPRSRYSMEEAREWLREHSFSASGKVDVTSQYYRFRQSAPGEFKRIRTKEVAGGVELLIGFN